MPQNTKVMPFKDSQVGPKCNVNSGVVPRRGKFCSDQPKTDYALAAHHGPAKGADQVEKFWAQ